MATPRQPRTQNATLRDQTAVARGASADHGAKLTGTGSRPASAASPRDAEFRVAGGAREGELPVVFFAEDMNWKEDFPSASSPWQLSEADAIAHLL